jgi:hypothetical protein
MHTWGDYDFDWEGLNKAMEYIYSRTYYFSLCRISCKEKYGSVRYEFITTPFSRYNNSIAEKCGRLYERLAWHVVKHVVFKAAKKWPHLEDELLEDLAINEELVGKSLHDKYWTTYK